MDMDKLVVSQKAVQSAGIVGSKLGDLDENPPSEAEFSTDYFGRQW